MGAKADTGATLPGASLIEQLEPVVGAPVRLEVLRQKTGRRCTYRAHGSVRNAIVKVYAPGRARAVAERLQALAEGPTEPRIPEVLWVSGDEVVALSEIEGTPLRAAVLAGDAIGCRRAGAVLGFWHRFWRDRAPSGFVAHSFERELAILQLHAEQASEPVAAAVRFALDAVEEDDEWQPSTVVHRDLWEEQLLLGDDVGLIDLDDAALGPPELDVGNLCAHLELLARRYQRDLDPMQRAFLDGYLSSGAPLELPLLLRSRSLSLLRLACIHRTDELATAYLGSAWPPPMSA